MARRSRNKNNKGINFAFYLTNAFGKGKEHYGLQISEDDNTWTFLTLTHTPTGHYRLRRDPISGKTNPEVSFLNTPFRTKPIGTRLRLDKKRKLSKEDEEIIKNLIKKKVLLFFVGSRFLLISLLFVGFGIFKYKKYPLSQMFKVS